MTNGIITESESHLLGHAHTEHKVKYVGEHSFSLNLDSDKTASHKHISYFYPFFLFLFVLRYLHISNLLTLYKRLHTLLT